MALPLAEMSSIIFEVSGIISILCFMTKFASTQSINAPLVSGKDLNVDNVLLLVFTLRLFRGVGDSGKSAYATGIDTEFLLFVVVLTDATFQYLPISAPNIAVWATAVSFMDYLCTWSGICC